MTAKLFAERGYPSMTMSVFGPTTIPCRRRKRAVGIAIRGCPATIDFTSYAVRVTARPPHQGVCSGCSSAPPGPAEVNTVNAAFATGRVLSPGRSVSTEGTNSVVFVEHVVRL